MSDTYEHTRADTSSLGDNNVSDDVDFSDNPILPEDFEKTIPDPNPFSDSEDVEDEEEEYYYDEEEQDGERLRLANDENIDKVMDELKKEDGPTPEQMKAFEELNIDAEKTEDEKPYVSEEAKRAFAETINKVTGERTKEQQQEEFTHDALIDKWKSFLSKYYITVAGERRYAYFEQILGLRAKVINKKGDIGSTIININFDDLITTDAIDHQKELVDGLTNHYSENIEAIKEAVFQLLYEIQPEYAEQIKNRLIISVLDSPNTTEIAEISTLEIDKLVRIEGQISQIDDENQMKVLQTSWECAVGHVFATGADIIAKPKRCTYKLDGDFLGDGKVSICGAPVVRERVDLQKVIDVCYIRVNEREIRIPEGRYDAPFVDVRFEGTELVKRIKSTIVPAQLVAIDGVVRTRQMSGSNHTLRDFEIEGSSYTVLPESVLIEDNPELDEEVRKPIPEHEIPEHFKKLVKSECPQLEGLHMVKLGLLVQQAGADATINIGGGRSRGDINILLVSSPSQGKSEMLLFVRKIRPRSAYVLGRGGSAVGLTAGIQHVDIVKNGIKVSTTRVGFGIYALCNQGICCIDEIEKRPKEDYESISHPMDDNQQMVVAKASIYKTIQANCASLHAGNPTKNNGNYDRTKDFFSQINFASWLYSRYDLVFVLEDDNSEARRDRLRDYISDAYTNVRLESEIMKIREGEKEAVKVEFDPNADWFPWQYLRREIMYLRETYHPVFKFNSDAGILLWKFWNRYSEINITPNTDPNAQPNERHFTSAVDKRSIGSLIRIAKAVARLFRSNEVELSHMEIAVRLKEASIMSVIPLQTTDQEAQSTLYLKSMTRTVAEQKMKEQRKGFIERQRDLRKKFVQFAMKIHHLFWEECKICGGSGRKKYLQSEADHAYSYGQCDNCMGSKGEYSKSGFTFQEIATRVPQMVGDVTPKQCTSFFQKLALDGWIRQLPGQVGYYRPATNLVEETKKLNRIPIGSELFIDEAAVAEIERLDQSLKLPTPKDRTDKAIFTETAEELERIGRHEEQIDSDDNWDKDGSVV